MKGMTNLVMLLIAMRGSAQSPAPAYRYAVAAQAAMHKRPAMKTDAILCKDGQVRTFPAGHPKPCI
ncbi:hypothetical protein WJ47_12520 [Burkholderia ubonensis]|uniref:Uncharacterized protein n=1 Tax=Burkholderia ubonensis TaxID=101571 RepID=A0AB73FSB5_9BURK|nr:hypothetical protein [Burkholderia ubonensis]KVK87644.1 hypothetical protein WJ44_32990 [Burkholderia ubonensis]KVL66171.1 hypothetical protein WJ47_12520 [Burkholderia ubonensis]KVM19906.1 hypothetical protein WJ53_22590 [Burkholderia ubonensis]KVM26791.1 hypothetical protein WJ54_16205 [Burkholderia ubonensis]